MTSWINSASFVFVFCLDFYTGSCTASVNLYVKPLKFFLFSLKYPKNHFQYISFFVRWWTAVALIFYHTLRAFYFFCLQLAYFKKYPRKLKNVELGTLAKEHFLGTRPSKHCTVIFSYYKLICLWIGWWKAYRPIHCLSCNV